MALTNCSNCTSEISTRAGACPHCGHRVGVQTTPSKREGLPDGPEVDRGVFQETGSDASVPARPSEWKRRLKWAFGGVAALFGLAVILYISYPGEVYINYADTENPYYAQLGSDIAEWGLFEEHAAGITASYLLPDNVNVWFTECGYVQAFYDPGTKEISLCFELVDALFDSFRPYAESEEDLAGSVWNTMLFVFYHEFGHALVDVLELPITGREEDSVDQLATLVLLTAVEGGINAALDGASWFSIQGASSTGPLAFADEHSLDRQRFFNIVCWVYGSNPEEHGSLIENWGLPPERAERCPFEFEQMERSWTKLLEVSSKGGAL
jgi:hypothetical protein